MFCTKCGNQIPNGMQFCSKCGTQVGGQQQPVQPQPPVMGAPIVKPPKKPMSRKTKIWIGIASGAAVLVAVALVLLFTLGDGGEGPLSGDTTQTKFVNDAVAVFSNAFEDFGLDTAEKMLDGPFDIKAELHYGNNTETIELAYDELALGISAQGCKLLVDDDKIDFYDGINVMAVDLRASGLDEPMTLKERFFAMINGLADDERLDIKELTEMLVNSIDDANFKKDGDTATLTLDFNSLLEMLETFGEMLDEDEEMEDALDELTGMKVSDALEMVVPILQLARDSADFELEIEIGYTGGRPASVEVKFDMAEDDYNDFEAELTYDKKGNATTVKLDIMTCYGKASTVFEVEKTGNSAEYEMKQSTDESGCYRTIKGSEEWRGEEVKGEVKESTELMGIRPIDMEYDLTLHFGMPEEPVDDDERFEMDMSGAYHYDIKEQLRLLRLATSFIDLPF